MGKDRSEDLTARVVAWHNRHPLAERILPLHVQSMGWVALPFVAGGEAGAVNATNATSEASAAAATPPARKSLLERAIERARHSLASVAAPQSGARDTADTADPANTTRATGTPAPYRRRGWKPAFSEDFIAPLAPRQVARFALRHGRTQAPEDGLPVREVPVDSGLAGTAAPTTLWLQTAAIERSANRLRLLVAPGAAMRAVGPRHWSASRRIFAGTFATLALAAALALLWPGEPQGGVMLARAPAPAASAAASAAAAARPPPAAASGGALLAAAPLPSAASAASAASPASAASAAITERAATVADAASTQHAPEATNAAQATDDHRTATAQASPRAPETPKAGDVARPTAAAAAPAPSVAPPPAPRRVPESRSPKGVRPNLGLQLDDDAKARARIAVLAAREAREAREAGNRRLASQRAASSPTAARPALLAAASVASSALPVGGGAASADHATWAVSTRSIRTRFESEQMLAAMRAVASESKGTAASALHFDVVPAGDDWRAVSWPFAERQEAERVRLALQERGLRVQVVPF